MEEGTDASQGSQGRGLEEPRATWSRLQDASTRSPPRPAGPSVFQRPRWCEFGIPIAFGPRCYPRLKVITLKGAARSHAEVRPRFSNHESTSASEKNRPDPFPRAPALFILARTLARTQYRRKPDCRCLGGPVSLAALSLFIII
jgi:hypothetical protein